MMGLMGCLVEHETFIRVCLHIAHMTIRDAHNHHWCEAHLTLMQRLTQGRSRPKSTGSFGEAWARLTLHGPPC